MESTFRRVYKTLILTAGLFIFAACSSDNDNAPKPQQDLPAFNNLTVRVGDTGNLTFNAYGTWTLSSDKTWFKLATETGIAGDQTVGYTVTDDGQGFLDDQATITFAIGTRSTTFTATRTAKDRALKLFSRVEDPETGDYKLVEVESIDLAYADNAGTYNANFAVVTNYDWKLTAPAWISVDEDNMSGDANPDETEPAIQWIQVNLAAAQADDMTGELVFADRNDASKHISKQVTCPGSTGYMIAKVNPETNFNPEGKYVATNPGGDVTIMDNYEFTITSGNEGVKFIYVGKDQWGYNPDLEIDWCDIAMTPKTVGPAVKEFTCKLSTGENTGDARMTTVVALPAAIAGSLTAADLLDDSWSEILEQYQPYVITTATQEGNIALVFAWGSPAGITIEKATESEIAELPEAYQGLKAFTMTFDSFEEYNMSTFKVSGYGMESEDSIIVPGFIQNGEIIETPHPWLSFEYASYGSQFSFSNNKEEWTASRSAWVILQEFNQDWDSGTQTYLHDIIAVKVIQNADY